MAISFHPTPQKCDVCGDDFPVAVDTQMYDAKTMFGPWACMCQRCWKEHNPLMQLGIGKGQKYERKIENGSFVLVEGAPFNTAD